MLLLLMLASPIGLKRAQELLRSLPPPPFPSLSFPFLPLSFLSLSSLPLSCCPCRVQVLFAYDPQEADELQLTPGVVIKVLQKNEEEGWCEGELNGKKGWFPDNFVETCPAPSSDSKVQIQ